MMTLKPEFKNANKKQLRKLVKGLINVHNQCEAQWKEEAKHTIAKVQAINSDLENLENEVEIRTSYTSELLRTAYHT